MSQAVFCDFLTMSPEPAGQVAEHPFTGGKSISTLAANGIHLYDDDDLEDDDEHPVVGGKSLSYYANGGHNIAGKSLPTAAVPSMTRYGESDFELSDSEIVTFLAEHPERLGAVLDEEPAILESFLAAEPIALSNYLQSNPSVLRKFFEAKPECLWAYFASCPEKLNQFCSAHPKFMSKWLVSRQATVQNYLNKNPALFWNHIQAHPSFQCGGRTALENSFTAGLRFDIPENQHHLIRHPVLWSLPKSDTNGARALRKIDNAGLTTIAVQGCAPGQDFEDTDEFDDAEHLEQLAAEDEAEYDYDDQVTVAGDFGGDNHNNASNPTLPQSITEQNLADTVLPSIEQEDNMFATYPSDSETSDVEDDMHATSQDSAAESSDEDEEYVESDDSENESEQDVILPGRRQVTGTKRLPKTPSNKKAAHKGFGGKSVPGYNSAGDSAAEEEQYEEEDSEVESSDEESDNNNSDNDVTPARAMVPYPAPQNLLNASRQQVPGKKWRLFEEDIVIGHMLDIRDEGIILSEERFRETCRRLEGLNNIVRSWGAVKNFWNRTGRARSGFDERKNKSAPLATSQQGKHLKKNKNKSSATSSRHQSTVPSGSKTLSKSASSKTRATPDKKHSKKTGLPSPSATPKSVSKNSVTSSASVEPTFSLEDVQKMQADFQAKMQAEFQASMRNEMQEMMKGLAQAAAQTVQPASTKSSDVLTSSKKRSRDDKDDLEDGQITDKPGPKKPCLPAKSVEAPSRHRIPERREDRERRPRTAMQKMFSSRRDSTPPVSRRSEADYYDHDEPARRSQGSYYHRDDYRNYDRQSDYYRRDDSRRYDDRRRADLRY